MRRLYALPILFMAVFLAGMTVAYADNTSRTVVNGGSSRSISGATFSDINVLQLNGGGIAVNNSGSLSVSNSTTFNEVHAKYGGGIWANGGAVINAIVDSTFTSATATENGGAIYNVGRFLGEIQNSTFTQNEARGTSRNSGYGGAIYFSRTKNSNNRNGLTIRNSSFNDNSASRQGGAIAMMNGNLTVVAKNGNSVFTNNRRAGIYNDIYMGGTNQRLNLTAYGNNKVDLEDGVDFNRGLTIYVNGAPTASEDKGDGTVVLGQLGSNSRRANMVLQGGTLSFINDSANNTINTIYANRVTVSFDTKLGFDVNLSSEGSSADIFNFNSIAGDGNFILNSDSFNILGDFTDESDSVTMSLIQSRANYRTRVQLFDENGKRTSVLYKYHYGENTPYLKIKYTSNGTFVFSNPEYIDAATNPLVYAFNASNDNNTRSFNWGRKVGTFSLDGTTATLNYRRNIILDSWEDLPDASDNNALKARNILIPDILNVNFNNRTVTAAEGITGMVINGENKTLNINNTVFSNFHNTLTAEKGTVNLSQTAFRGSKSEGEGGAAIRNTGATVNINGARRGNRTLFYNSNNNTSVTGSRKDINGGAIYNEGNGIMTINYATFGANPTTRRRVTTRYGNYATNGGAIYNAQSDVILPTEIDGQYNTVSNLNVTNSTFVANEASNNGGAVYNTYGAGGVTTASATVGGAFRRNTAVNDGGAIYNEGKLSTVGSTFGTRNRTAEANTATNGGAVANENGGQFLSDRSSYYSNRAAEKGGAIYNTGKNEETGASSTVTIQGGNFTANSAKYGAAIFNDEDATIILDAYTNPANQRQTLTTFSNNTSNGNGGAIYNLGTIAPSQTMIDTDNLPVAGTFSRNRATYNREVFTGVRVLNGVVTYGTNAPVSPLGGAIYNEGNLELTWGTFSSNSATANVSTSTLGYTENNKYGTAVITSAVGKGGAVYSAKDDLYITNSTFSRNSAAESGGAVHNEADSTVYVANGTFANNSARHTRTVTRTITMPRRRTERTRTIVGQGGAIYSKGDININSDGKYAKYGNNDAYRKDDDGNYIRDRRGNLIRNNDVGTTFSSNSSGTGGAIYTEKNAKMQNIAFSRNSATTATDSDNVEAGAGGAIFAKGDVLVNPNDYAVGNRDTHFATFSSNSAVNGGAIYSGGTTLIKNATFTSNRASNNGGAIYTTGEIRTVGSNFTSNRARNGGAVYVPANTNAYFIDTNFRNNTATALGGAIYAGDNSTVSIIAYDNNVTMTGNRAGRRANSIYLDNANLYVYARQYRVQGSDEVRSYRITINGVDGSVDGNNQVRLFCDSGNITDVTVTGRTENVNYTASIDGDQAYFENNVIGKHITDLKQNSEITTSDSTTGTTGDVTVPSGAKRSTLSFGNENLVKNCSVDLAGKADLNIANNTVGTLSLKKLTLADNTTTNVAIDADLKNAKADDIKAETTEGSGSLNVNKVNLTTNNKNAITLKLGKSVSSVTATTAQTREATYKLKEVVDPETGLIRSKSLYIGCSCCRTVRRLLNTD